MTEHVMVMMEIPVKEIDFSKCGDGVNEIYGLKKATFKGHAIDSFLDNDVAKAEAAMHESLGYKSFSHYDRQAELAAFRDELNNNDLVAANRRAG